MLSLLDLLMKILPPSHPDALFFCYNPNALVYSSICLKAI